MAFERLDLTRTKDDEQYLNVSNEEIVKVYKRIAGAYFDVLHDCGMKVSWFKRKGIKEAADIDRFEPQELVDKLSQAELQLVFLALHLRKLVHKDLISEFVRRHIPDAAHDQQPRHLGSQMYWNVLSKGVKIPDEDECVPSGYYCCLSIEQPSKLLLFFQKRRDQRISAKDFAELKAIYKNKCATCGREEGTKDERNSDAEIVLQQGHMNPRKELTLDNAIPQCPYCNRTYQDYFCYNEDGRIMYVNNPSFVLKSPKSIQQEMLVLLRRKLQED